MNGIDISSERIFNACTNLIPIKYYYVINLNFGLLFPICHAIRIIVI